MIEPEDIPGRLPLAYRNREFMDTADARSLRILSEYLYPLSHFRKEKIRDTIVFFGSARTFESAENGRYYREARELARRITEWSNSLHEASRRFVICSGGGPGIMEAANRGAQDAGGKTIGLNIGLPMEQRPNPFITPDLNFEFHYFFMRKFWFAYLAKALVVFPGGFGTLDELTEILTLVQTQKLVKKIVVVLYGTSFWKEIINFEALVRHGMISEEDLNLFQFADDVDGAFQILESGLTKHYLELKRRLPSPSREYKSPVNLRLHTAFQWMGKVGIAFLLFLLLWVTLILAAPQSEFSVIAFLGIVVTGVWLTVRLLRLAAKQAIWRLRNRLLVTYLFIALVPILLVATLAGLLGYFLVSEFSVYLVTSELDRRIESIAAFTDSVVHTDPVSRPNAMQRTIDLFYRERYPGIEILLRESGHEIRYPEEATIPAPVPGWQPAKGVLMRKGQFYVWSYASTPTGDVTVTVPLTKEFLGDLVPNLGRVDVGEWKSNASDLTAEARRIAAGRALPPTESRFDPDVLSLATLPMDDWNRPGETGERMYVGVQSRFSAVLAAVLDRKADLAQSTLRTFLIIGVTVFVAVEIISLLIGFGMTRTITGAVHRLYEGTQRVIAGDFTHRIEVSGHDQFAELSHSFNRMTENMERLLVVAKEKERLESEIEIARDVQDQLFPREVPQLGTLRLTGVCQPARLVSGDYYDYETVGENQVAVAIADVAGKGISAALLMAGLQSSLRTQLQDYSESAEIAPDGRRRAAVSTSRLVSNLNRQLYATTSPEKYATFCLGVYDEAASIFTYTNAGHLPPLLVRDGGVETLDVNGTVVGAFPFSQYEESQVKLQPGDLLVCYTDGITEPENEYGEMFGETRLRDLLARNADRPDQEIIDMVLDAVRQWTATEELQDDMTLLLARRVAATPGGSESEPVDSSLAVI